MPSAAIPVTLSRPVSIMQATSLHESHVFRSLNHTRQRESEEFNT